MNNESMTNKGKLPEGWKRVPLGEVCNFISGFAFKKESLLHSRINDNYLPVVKIGSFDRNGNIAALGFDYYAYTNALEDYLININDALVAMTGATVGKVAVSQVNNYLLNQRVGVIRNNEYSDQNYLNNVLMTDGFYDYCQKTAEGGAQGNISPEYIKAYKIPLPPLPEQRRIAAIIETQLAAVDKAKKAAAEQQAAAGALAEAYLREVFDFDELPEGWKLVKLKNICELARGGSPRPIQSFITNDDNGVNWIKIGDADINSKYLEKTSEKITPEGATHSRKVYPGDFILSNSMSFGRPYILKTEGCIHDGWLVLGNISDEINQNYLYHVLSSSAVKQQFSDTARGAIVKNLNIEIVKEVLIPLPPLSEQRRIAAHLEKKLASVEKTRRLLQEQAEAINALPAAILRKAFAGEM